MKRLLTLLTIMTCISCQDAFELYPPDRLSPATAFNTADDLQLYVNSFYNNLPTGNTIVRGDALSDYLVGRSPSQYLTGTFNAAQATGWGWGALRNINYFLEHFRKAEIPEEELNHYEGMARFFRAWFYYDKVKQFGDVPWYDTVLDVADEDLYKPRDPRSMVMEQVLADLDFAGTHIRPNKDNTASFVNKWVALGFKSRVCLFEGTLRKYHPELGLQETADFWLEQAAEAAQEVIENGQYQLNMQGPLELSYRNLFIHETPNTTEIMLAAVNSLDLRVFNDANWYWTSATYGGRYSFIKSFINTFLMRDGSRFTDRGGYDEMPFWEEVEDRDLRLQQVIRMRGYEREGVPTPPSFTYTYTGYHPLKFTLDSRRTDGVAENNNSLPIMRYAEVLLNYAEARAELGTLTQAAWELTIGKLRERAGLTDTGMPSSADNYLMGTYFPEISDPLLLEVRRERGIELCLEGFRFDDLVRWRKGELLEMPHDGMYVPEMDTAYDLNSDGNPDVAFVTQTPQNPAEGVYYFIIDGNQHKLTGQSNGKIIAMDNFVRRFEDHQYFYPIPFDEIVLNPNLEQNPGWE
ncbi:RagB/SusD family nutrient uptake outer membrane protein [Negadavirga shengliensis]|uniref:RagB/SusD family nutrient uptake outer membrane protein n=1 Tax=Negadavirga shengliensis TaxID=1389218 RepID=A0ABV9T7X1_9BACT